MESGPFRFSRTESLKVNWLWTLIPSMKYLSTSIPGSGRSPGEGSGNPLQCSCLENSLDRACGLQSMGFQRAGYDWEHAHTHTQSTFMVTPNLVSDWMTERCCLAKLIHNPDHHTLPLLILLGNEVTEGGGLGQEKRSEGRNGLHNWWGIWQLFPLMLAAFYSWPFPS